MTSVGIDIGGRAHVAAHCRTGETRADRKVLRIAQSRAGFDALDAWLAAGPEPVEQVVMESSGHYWIPLASHLGRRGVAVSVVNPLAAKYVARSRLGRTKSDPADARSLAEMGMREQLPTRDPLAGLELRQAARFAMTLVGEQAKVCQRLYRLVELGFPELRELFDDPTCRTARAVLRLAPTARGATRRRTATLADANKGPGRRRLGEAKAERLQRRAGCRPFPASVRQPRQRSSPRSATSSGSPTSTSCWPMRASTRPSAVLAPRARDRTRHGA